jgi:DNA-binding MarR family transcriptional regulator/GNAT superfamily N-acetyltransferase
LRRSFLNTPFSLTEARILYELAHRNNPTATKIGKDLDLDAGYLSRLIKRFQKEGLVQRRTSEADRREDILSLTKKGKGAFAELDERSRIVNAQMLRELSVEDRARLVGAMETIEGLINAKPVGKRSYIIRGPRPGDMGWVVHRHGVLYSDEYGWDERFEGLVAGIVARFVENCDSKRERCWIAEREGEIVGCVFLVKHSKTVGQLRLLLVEPKARGFGIGTRLVEECIAFAREVGYKKIILWTNSALHAARRIYDKKGFRLASLEAHQDLGGKLAAHEKAFENNLLTLTLD